MGIIYKDLFGGSGHSVIWEITNGKLEIRDGQAHIVSQTLNNVLKTTDITKTKILRTDDLVPDIDRLVKDGLLRTDNNTKYVVDHLAEIGVNLLKDPIIEAEILGIAYGGYKLNNKINESKSKEKMDESRQNNQSI